MVSEFVTVRNTRNGQVARMLRSHAEHPILGREVVIVEDGAKSYAPGMYVPVPKEEYAETPRGKREAKKNDGDK